MRFCWCFGPLHGIMYLWFYGHNAFVKEKEHLVQYLRRLIWYVASRLLIILIVLGLITTAFYFSMNATNIYIILKDGMARRAQVILMDTGDDLSVYFAPAYLERDPMLLEVQNGVSVYRNYYSVTGIDHRIHLDSFWCWPWDDTAQATITEEIPGIDGKLNQSGRDNQQNMNLTSQPQWQKVQYNVLLTKENNQWRIKNLTVARYIN